MDDVDVEHDYTLPGSTTVSFINRQRSESQSQMIKNLRRRQLKLWKCNIIQLALIIALTTGYIVLIVFLAHLHSALNAAKLQLGQVRLI